MLEKLQKQLQQAFEKLTPKLNELRDKIPLSFLKRKKTEEESVEVVEGEETQQEAEGEQQEVVTSSDQTTELSGSEEALAQTDSHATGLTKAEKKKKYIRIAVASLVLVYFVADHFSSSSSPESENNIDSVAQEKIAAQRKKNKEAKEAAKKAKEEKLAQENTEQQQEVSKAEEVPVADTASVPGQESTPSVESSGEVVATTPTTTEAVSVAEIPATEATNPTVAETPALTPPETISSNPVSTEVLATSNSNDSSNAATPSPAATITDPSSPVVSAEEQTPNPVAATETVATSDPSPASISPSIEESSTIAPQTIGVGEAVRKEAEKESVEMSNNLDNTLGAKVAESTVEYTKAEYNQIGRGLVYNCKGKHWACVARDSWFKCKNNEKWSSANTKDKECKTIDVYASEDDCRTVQINNINTRKETSFCK